MAKSSSFHAVCPKLLLVMVACAIGGAFFLIPRDKELWTRLAADSDESRLMEIADNQSRYSLLTPAGSAGNSATAAELAAKQESAKATAALEMVFEKFNFADLTSEEQSALKELVGGSSHPVECWLALHKPGRFDSLPRGYAQSLADSIAQQAISENNPALAAQIYEECAEDIKSCPTEILEHSIQAFRFVRKSKAALMMLDEVQSRRPLSADEFQVQIDLCRETNNYPRAYALLKKQFEGVEDLMERDRILRELVACADETQRENEIAEMIRELLRCFPQNDASLVDLHKMRTQKENEQMLTTFANRCADFALYIEWSEKPDWDAALRHHAKAAVLGHKESLARVESLSGELARPEEFLSVLKIICPVIGRPDLTLALARAVASNGEYPKAAAHYEAYLLEKPKDASVWFEAGCLQLELQRVDDAERSFCQAVLLDPLELEHHTRWAETLVQLKRYEDALQVYRAISVALHDIGSLENFQLLAESLGDTELTVEVARNLLKKRLVTKSLDWLDLADLQMENGDASGALQTLVAGRNAHPQSCLLLQAQVQILQMQKRLPEARNVLLAATCAMEMKTACLMVEVFADLEDPSCLSKLPPDVVSAYPWPSDTLTQLAYLCELGGRLNDAQALYRRAAESGSNAAADMLVTLSDEADPQAWLRLGDILRSLNREEEAKAAYQKSLQIIRERAEEQISDQPEDAKEDGEKAGNDPTGSPVTTHPQPQTTPPQPALPSPTAR